LGGGHLPKLRGSHSFSMLGWPVLPWAWKSILIIVIKTRSVQLTMPSPLLKCERTRPNEASFSCLSPSYKPMKLKGMGSWMVWTIQYHGCHAAEVSCKCGHHDSKQWSACQLGHWQPRSWFDKHLPVRFTHFNKLHLIHAASLSGNGVILH